MPIGLYSQSTAKNLKTNEEEAEFEAEVGLGAAVA